MRRGSTPRPSPSSARPWPSGSRHWGRITPIPVASYNSLAANLDEQGKLAEAVGELDGRRGDIDRAHPRRVGCLGVGALLDSAPLAFAPLAMALARQGQFHDAWVRWETDLARGLLDDLSARLLRPLTHRPASPRGRPGRPAPAADERITPPGRARPTHPGGGPAARRAAQPAEYPPRPVGRVPERAGPAISSVRRQALDPGGDPEGPPPGCGPGRLARRDDDHWACIVRATGRPAWVEPPRLGQGWSRWTREDERASPGRCVAALVGHQVRPGPRQRRRWRTSDWRRCCPI